MDQEQNFSTLPKISLNSEAIKEKNQTEKDQEELYENKNSENSENNLKPFKGKSSKKQTKKNKEEKKINEEKNIFISRKEEVETVLGSPLEKVEGIVSVEGNLITFVADNINDIIKKDANLESFSPLTVSNSSSLSSSNSGWSHVEEIKKKLNFSPLKCPPPDPSFLTDLETEVQLISKNLDNLFINYSTHMNKLSSCSLETVDLYNEVVHSTCESADQAIKYMYSLMAKCEELDKKITPLYSIKDRVKEIKRLLDVFEKQLVDDEM